MNKKQFANWFLGLSALFFLLALTIPNTSNAQLPWPNECASGCCHCMGLNVCNPTITDGIGYTYCVSGHVSCGYAGSECTGVGEG